MFSHYAVLAPGLLLAEDVLFAEDVLLAEEVLVGVGRYLLVGEVALMALVRAGDHPQGESLLVDGFAREDLLVFEAVLAEQIAALVQGAQKGGT